MKIIDPATSRNSQAYEEQPAKKQTKSKKPARRATKKSNNKPANAREAARELAREKYGIETRTPLSAADRQRNRRAKLVGVSFELEPEVAAKLLALAEANGQSQVAVIRDLIVNAEL